MPSHFDLLAPFYDRVIGAPALDRLTQLLCLPIAGRVLEAGGGTGRKASLFQGQAGNVVVGDLSFPMLRAAQRRRGLGLVQCRTERLPFVTGCFERILLADALHHFQNQMEALGEAVRVLHPGGRLVIEEPDITKLPGKALALAERLFLMHSRFLSADEITTWISRQGLRPVVDREDGISVRIAVDK